MRTLLTTVMAAAMLTGASVAFAAENNNPGTGFSNSENGPSLDEKEMLIDRTTTGSIMRGNDSTLISKDCISQRLDAAGNCIIDKDY